MEAVIVAFLTGVLGPVLVIFIKNKLDSNKKKPDTLLEAVVNANLINEELDKLADEYSADRIWVAQFHNGGHFYPTGKSIQKFSIFFEFVKKHTQSIQMTFQNIPVNLFSKALGQVYEHDYAAIPDYKDEATATYGLKHIAEENGTKSSYIFAIKTVENKLIGVIGIEYITRKKSLSDTDIINLRLEASKLGGVLMSQLK